jgi:hypothetical protein
MVEIRIIEVKQCSDLASYLLLSFCILSISGFVVAVPCFILTLFPHQSDEVAGPFYPVIRVGLFKGLRINKLLLQLLPFGRPSPKDEMIPSNAVLALEKQGDAGSRTFYSQLFIPWSIRAGTVWRNSNSALNLVQSQCSGSSDRWIMAKHTHKTHEPIHTASTGLRTSALKF